MSNKEEIALDFINVYRKYKERSYFSKKMKEVRAREKLHNSMRRDEAQRK